MRRILPSRVAEVQREALGVPAGASVAEADVQELVGSECELAAVVVRVRLVDREHFSERGRIEPPGRRIDRELGDDGVTGAVDVVDVGEIGRRMEGETEQPLLTVRVRAFGDVEHHVGAFVGHGDHPAGLLDDVDLRVTRTMGHIDGLVERTDVEQEHDRFHQRRGNGRRAVLSSLAGGRVVGSVGDSVVSTVVDGVDSAAVGGGPDPN